MGTERKGHLGDVSKVTMEMYRSRSINWGVKSKRGSLLKWILEIICE